MRLFEQLPITWLETTLGDISLDIRYGLTARAESDLKGLFYLRISDINDFGEVVRRDPKYVAQSDKLQKYLLEPGDIVIARSGSVGRSFVYTGSDDPWVFASYLIRFRINQEIADPQYIGFYLRSPVFWRYVEAMTRTVAQPNINSKELSSLPVPLPTLPEQRRIVEILRQADVLRRMREDVATKSNDLLLSVFQYTFGTLDKLGSRWEVVTVEAAGEVRLGRQRAPQYQTGKYTHPYLRVANVYENQIDLSDLLSMDFNEREFERYHLQYGDILLNEGQSIELVGRPAIWRDELPGCCFQNTLIRFRSSGSPARDEGGLFEVGRIGKNG